MLGGHPRLDVVHFQESAADGLRCAIATVVQQPYLALVPQTDLRGRVVAGTPPPLAAVEVYLNLASWAMAHGRHMRLHYPPPWDERLWVGIGRHATYPQRRAVVFSARAVIHDPGERQKLPPVTRIDFGLTFEPREP